MVESDGVPLVSLKARARALVVATGQCKAGTGRTIGKEGEHISLNANADHDTQVHATIRWNGCLARVRPPLMPPSGPHSRWPDPEPKWPRNVKSLL